MSASHQPNPNPEAFQPGSYVPDLGDLAEPCDAPNLSDIDEDQPQAAANNSACADQSQEHCDGAPDLHKAKVSIPAVLTGRELLDTEVPKPVAIVEGLFFEGKDSITGGHYGIGKTTASLHIGAGIAAGETVFGLRVIRPYRVLYIDLELGVSEFKERYGAIQALYRNHGFFF